MPRTAFSAIRSATSGTLYCDPMAVTSTLSSTAVADTALVVRSVDRSPESISELLGVPPTRSVRIGQPLSRRHPGDRTHMSHLWVWSEGEQQGDRLEDQVLRLCELVEGRDVRELDLRAQVALSADHDGARFAIGSRVVARLARLPLTLTFDLYPPPGGDKLPQQWKATHCAWVTSGTAGAESLGEALGLSRQPRLEQRVDAGGSPQQAIEEQIATLLSDGPPKGVWKRVALSVRFMAVNGQGSIAFGRDTLQALALESSGLEFELLAP